MQNHIKRNSIIIVNWLKATANAGLTGHTKIPIIYTLLKRYFINQASSYSVHLFIEMAVVMISWYFLVPPTCRSCIQRKLQLNFIKDLFKGCIICTASRWITVWKGKVRNAVAYCISIAPSRWRKGNGHYEHQFLNCICMSNWDELPTLINWSLERR